MSFINKNQKEDFSTKFYEQFKGLIPSLSKLKIASHIGSFCTQLFVIILLMMSNLPIQSKIICAVLAVVIGLFVSTIIETGLSKFLPYTIQQLLGWNFHNKWFVSMFFALLIFIVLPLSVASPTLSGIGGNELVDKLMKRKQRPSTTHLDQKLTAIFQEIDSIANVEKLAITNSHSKQEQPIKNKYNALIQIQKNIIAKYRKIYKTKKWAIGHIQKAENKIESLKAEMNSQLSPTLAAQTDVVNNLNARTKAEKSYHRNNIEKEKAAILADWQEQKEKRDFNQFIWGNITAGLAIFFSFGTFACIFIMELFKKGSGNALEVVEDEGKSGKFSFQFLNELGGKIMDILPTGKVVSKAETNTVSETETVINPESETIGFKPSYMQKPKPVSKPKNKKGKPSSALETTHFPTVSAKDVEKILKTETVLLKPEVSAQVKLKKKQIQSYQWKLRNKKGKSETANKNIARLVSEINELKNLKL